MTTWSIPVHVSVERPARSSSGYAMLTVALGLLGLFVIDVIVLAATHGHPPLPPAVVVSSLIVLPMLFVSVVCGFYMIQPNQAAAITLFGSYQGTDRTHGLRWVWPWLGRTRISIRANNVVSEKLKVNDLRGNPIEIATNVVWRVADTARPCSMSMIIAHLCWCRSRRRCARSVRAIPMTISNTPK